MTRPSTRQEIGGRGDSHQESKFYVPEEKRNAVYPSKPQPNYSIGPVAIMGAAPDRKVNASDNEERVRKIYERLTNIADTRGFEEPKDGPNSTKTRKFLEQVIAEAPIPETRDLSELERR